MVFSKNDFNLDVFRLQGRKPDNKQMEFNQRPSYEEDASHDDARDSSAPSPCDVLRDYVAKAAPRFPGDVVTACWETHAIESPLTVPSLCFMLSAEEEAFLALHVLDRLSYGNDASRAANCARLGVPSIVRALRLAAQAHPSQAGVLSRRLENASHDDARDSNVPDGTILCVMWDDGEEAFLTQAGLIRVGTKQTDQPSVPEKSIEDD